MVGTNWDRLALIGNLPPQAQELLEEALEKHPDFSKVDFLVPFLLISNLSPGTQLWMMRGQLEEQRGDITAARDIYTRGVHLSPSLPSLHSISIIQVKRNPSSVPIWLLLSRLEERNGRSRDHHVTTL